MAWFQVDDQLAMHRKVCEAGNAAMGLWVRAGAWSMANLTEGFVSKSAAKTLGSAAQVKSLIDAGLWVNAQGGYQFHEWGTRQMSAEQIAERRRKRAEAGAKGGQRSGESRRGSKAEANGEANHEALASAEAKQKRTPVPVPALSVVTSGGNVTRVDARDPNDPPPRCPDHPNGTQTACGGCGRANEELKAWRRSQANARRREIADCPRCDPSGWLLDADGVSTTPAIRCPAHTWEHAHA